MSGIFLSYTDLVRIADALQVPLATLLSLIFNVSEQDLLGGGPGVAAPRLMSVVPEDLDKILSALDSRTQPESGPNEEPTP